MGSNPATPTNHISLLVRSTIYLAHMRVSAAVDRFNQAPKIAKLLVAQQFLEGFTPIMALYAIMFSRVGHLNLQQIGWLFSIWGLAYVVAELPLGVLADRWSRRNVIVMGGLIRCVGFLIWLKWPTFTGYAIGFALWGVMISCTSGAVAAYLESELQHTKQARAFSKYFGWVMAANSFGALVGYIIAASITLRHTSVLIWLSVISSALFIILLFAPEQPYAQQRSYLTVLQSGVREVIASKKLRFVCSVMFSIYMIIGVLEELLPRVYANFGLNDSWVSLLGAAALLVSVLLLTRLESVIRFSLSKQILIMAGGVGLLLAGLIWNVAAASILILSFNLIFHLFRPVFMHHVQDVAKSEERATINSIPGMFGGILGAGAFAIIGRIAQHRSQSYAIGVYALFWLVILLLFASVGRVYSVDVDSS